ncbi:MAG: ABC transporter substrate-binding protein [Microbacterium gubbeenense]|uniref:ABC transporter substrate-binding protein n=1 Tax=Microbacterium gubbeenense TaxID=159896 RepID=UPI003F9D5BB6
MLSTRTFRTGAIVTTALAAAALAGCASEDPLATPEEEQESGGAVVVGSQAYYSNETIAEIYAQALEAEGFDVEKLFNIGQRDAYMPQLESGAITLFPEYSGNLLQFYDAETTARSSDDVYAELEGALPDGLTALEQATATDQDSYTVTREFADEHGLSSIADLADISDQLTLGGPPELAERPYGPDGLKSVYDIDVEFSGTGDTTVEDLLAGTIDVANVFTADPRIQTEDLVVLDDPESLILASNVVPIANADRAEELAPVIDAVSEKLTPEALVALNVSSQVDEESPGDIAAAWLSDNGITG